MEGGLAQPPLPRVELAFAREQPLALLERVLVGHEHVLDLVGVPEEEDEVPPHPEADGVAVLPRGAGEESDGVAADLE